MKRSLFAGAALVAAAIMPVAGHAQGTIKVGIILPYSGQFAHTATELDAGIKLYVKQHGDTVAGKKIVTIEGLGAKGLHRVQKAWIEHEVPQCGYCQTGMIMAASALLAKNSKPADADIDAAMTNLCRCGTYARVRKAIHSLAGTKVADDPAPVEAPNGQKI